MAVNPWGLNGRTVISRGIRFGPNFVPCLFRYRRIPLICSLRSWRAKAVLALFLPLTKIFFLTARTSRTPKHTRIEAWSAVRSFLDFFGVWCNADRECVLYCACDPGHALLHHYHHEGTDTIRPRYLRSLAIASLLGSTAYCRHYYTASHPDLEFPHLSVCWRMGTIITVLALRPACLPAWLLQRIIWSPRTGSRMPPEDLDNTPRAGWDSAEEHPHPGP